MPATGPAGNPILSSNSFSPSTRPLGESHRSRPESGGRLAPDRDAGSTGWR
jgi:hypothetical protein